MLVNPTVVMSRASDPGTTVAARLDCPAGCNRKVRTSRARGATAAANASGKAAVGSGREGRFDEPGRLRRGRLPERGAAGAHRETNLRQRGGPGDHGISGGVDRCADRGKRHVALGIRDHGERLWFAERFAWRVAVGRLYDGAVLMGEWDRTGPGDHGGSARRDRHIELSARETVRLCDKCLGSADHACVHGADRDCRLLPFDRGRSGDQYDQVAVAGTADCIALSSGGQLQRQIDRRAPTRAGAGRSAGARKSATSAQAASASGARRLLMLEKRMIPPWIGRSCRFQQSCQPKVAVRAPAPDRYTSRLMSKICHSCGKKPAFGNSRSHSMVATKRRFDPNLQKVGSTTAARRAAFTSAPAA